MQTSKKPKQQPVQRKMGPIRYQPYVVQQPYASCVPVQGTRRMVTFVPRQMNPPPPPIVSLQRPNPPSKEKNTDSYPYRCYCGQNFATEQDYSEHTEHQKCIQWDTIRYENDRVICACSLEFTDPLSLEMHLKDHACLNIWPPSANKKALRSPSVLD